MGSWVWSRCFNIYATTLEQEEPPSSLFQQCFSGNSKSHPHRERVAYMDSILWRVGDGYNCGRTWGGTPLSIVERELSNDWIKTILFGPVNCSFVEAPIRVGRWNGKTSKWKNWKKILFSFLVFLEAPKQ